MPLRNYLAAIAIFCNEVNGKSALALSRDLGVQYKTAFVLAHKLREAMASELKGMQLGGQGETVEVDGGYFGGYVKPANFRENRRDRKGPVALPECVLRMSNEEAETAFARIRWHTTDGKPNCPKCGCEIVAL
jgi:hypothetical protein